MKYLKKVILKNFQSHKHSIIEFDQGLNIIVGPSDSGKTSVIRGIKWALYNEPSGDYFIREGEKEASVTLEFSNDIKIRRLRSKSKNAYIIINSEGEEIVFEGFGNKVPKEIVDLIGIEKVPLDTNESNAINLGEQLEGAFLLSEKGSTRASAIGRLVGVNLIDDALKDTLKDVRNISIKKKTISESIKDIEEELKSYEYLEKLKEDLLKLENNRNSIKYKSDTKTKLISAMESYNAIQINYNTISNLLNKLDIINEIENNLYKIEIKNKQLNIYKNLQSRLNESDKSLHYNNYLVNELANNDIIESLVKKVEKLINTMFELKAINTKMVTYKNKIADTYINIEALKPIEEISININNIEKRIGLLNKLRIIQENKAFLDKSITLGKVYLLKLEKLDEIDMSIRDLEILTQKVDKILSFSKKLHVINIEMQEQIKLLNSSTNNINKTLKEYQELLKQNETCPFCLSVINEDKIEHIIKHYS